MVDIDKKEELIKSYVQEFVKIIDAIEASIGLEEGEKIGIKLGFMETLIGRVGGNFIDNFYKNTLN